MLTFFHLESFSSSALNVEVNNSNMLNVVRNQPQFQQTTAIQLADVDFKLNVIFRGHTICQLRAAESLSVDDKGMLAIMVMKVLLKSISFSAQMTMKFLRARQTPTHRNTIEWFELCNHAYWHSNAYSIIWTCQNVLGKPVRRQRLRAMLTFCNIVCFQGCSRSATQYRYLLLSIFLGLTHIIT